MLIAAGGFMLGLLASQMPGAWAEATPPSEQSLTQKRFLVSVDEVKQNFVFAEEFVGSYKKELVLSDGSKRSIELTPMIRDGKKVVEFKDTGGTTYMGLSGTTTNGVVMVQLRDLDVAEAQLVENGWRK